MKFTNEDLENIRKSFSYDNAVKLLKAMANHKKFITKGVGKGLIEAYNIDIKQIADDNKMQKKITLHKAGSKFLDYEKFI